MSGDAFAAPADYLDVDGAYYAIDVPAADLSDFFTWSPDYPSYFAAHRGGGYLPGFPENALETMRHTLRHGPAIMEIDIQRSKDGVLLLLHDDTLERTTTGSGVVADTAWAEIRQLELLDINGDPTGYQVPTLREVLTWGDDRTLFALDVKADAYIDEVVDLVTEMRAEDDVFIFADSVEQMAAIHHRNPALYFALFFTPETTEDLLVSIREAGIPLRQVAGFTVAEHSDSAMNAALHAAGMISIFGAFIPEYYADEEQLGDLYEEILNAGADVIATNRVPELAAALGYEPR